MDGSVFKKQLKMDKPLIEEQCKIVHKLFDAFVRHLTELKWNVFSGTPKTPVMLAKFWSASGFEAISDTISAVTLQVRHSCLDNIMPYLGCNVMTWRPWLIAWHSELARLVNTHSQ